MDTVIFSFPQTWTQTGNYTIGCSDSQSFIPKLKQCHQLPYVSILPTADLELLSLYNCMSQFLIVNLFVHLSVFYPICCLSWEQRLIQRSYIHGRISCAYGLEDIILLRWEYYPKRFSDSVQSLAKLNDLFFLIAELEKPIFKFTWNCKGPK